jgi:hypothetical protein
MAETAHTTSTGHPAEGGHGVFPPFQSETFASQLVWLAIAFVLLYGLMAKLALPRVGSIINNRHKRIADDVAEASRLKGESDAAVAAYEKALADARVSGRRQRLTSAERRLRANSTQSSRMLKRPSPAPNRRRCRASAELPKMRPAPSSIGLLARLRANRQSPQRSVPC